MLSLYDILTGKVQVLPVAKIKIEKPKEAIQPLIVLDPLYRGKPPKGICPHCKFHDRIISRSGRIQAYCNSCAAFKQKAIHFAQWCERVAFGPIKPKRNFSKFVHYNNPNFEPKLICPTCNVRPKIRSKNGKIRPYCAECSHDRYIEQRKVKVSEEIAAGLRDADGRLLIIKRTGSVPKLLCSRCGERPRINAKRSECRECWSNYMREYMRKNRKKYDGRAYQLRSKYKLVDQFT